MDWIRPNQQIWEGMNFAVEDKVGDKHKHGKTSAEN